MRILPSYPGARPVALPVDRSCQRSIVARCAAAVLATALAVSGAAFAGNMGTDQQRAEGKELYDKYCSQCHGTNGDGVGYATYRLQPQPRDFTSGQYKFRTTPSGMLPTDEDIFRVIQVGLPYTSMPGWPMFSDADIYNIVYHLKTFSTDFENPDKEAPPIEIPAPPEMNEESVVRGQTVYEMQGCATCHGKLGRGDGPSVRTLVDEWGQPLRSADMTQRWTFRGGPTRTDIFRTFSTGLNGTPMPSFADSLEVSDRWDLVNYIYSLNNSDDPQYKELVAVRFVEDDLNIDDPELFADVPRARFPLIGQIVEPGRNFYPTVSSIETQGVYNQKEIAIRLSWHNMSAEATGSNSPILEVPPWDEDNPIPEASSDDADEGDDFWGDEVEEDEEDEGDFWGEEGEDEDDADAGYSDAVALQFPSELPSGVRKPYFIFGDVQKSVDLWFVDLARSRVEQFTGRGSTALEPSETDEIEVVTQWDEGEWSVIFKRSLRGGGVDFVEGQFVPLSFSVWDGFNNERGNKRALSPWFYLYMNPREQVSPLGPMLKVGGIVFVLELIAIFLIRRRFVALRSAAEVAPDELAAGAPS